MKRKRLIFLMTSGGVLLVLALMATYAFWIENRYLPRTSIAGASVGGLTKEEAKTLLENKVNAYNDRTITLRFEEKSWSLKGVDFGSTWAIEKELEQVWDNQKSGSILEDLQRLVAAPFASRTSELGFTAISEEGQKKLRETVLKDIEKGYQETSLKITSKGVEIVPGKAGSALDGLHLESLIYGAFRNGSTELALSLKPFEPELTAEQATSAKAQAERIIASGWTAHIGPTKQVEVKTTVIASWLDTTIIRDAAGKATELGLVLKDEAVKSAIGSWKEGIEVAPVNARLALDSATNSLSISSPGKEGVRVDQDATLEATRKAILGYKDPQPRILTAKVETEQPAVRQDTLANLGLTQKIGTATTDYTGSPANRKANITTGQKKLDLILIQPGETFSTIGHLAPIDASTGYLPELVIKGNRTVPDFGGGLCQVSTTLFRSILNAGLPIVERQNHAYRVGYYEREVGPGLDATIYDPKPDFRWKNDTGHAVLLQSSITGNKVTFDLYGTSDGRKSTVSKGEILEETPSGNPIYMDTDTLPVGTKKQVETAHPGAKTRVTYTVERDGKEINKQIFLSTYKPWPAQYLVGTKPVEAAPAPTPSATESTPTTSTETPVTPAP